MCDCVCEAPPLQISKSSRLSPIYVLLLVLFRRFPRRCRLMIGSFLWWQSVNDLGCCWGFFPLPSDKRPHGKLTPYKRNLANLLTGTCHTHSHTHTINAHLLKFFFQVVLFFSCIVLFCACWCCFVPLSPYTWHQSTFFCDDAAVASFYLFYVRKNIISRDTRTLKWLRFVLFFYLFCVIHWILKRFRECAPLIYCVGNCRVIRVDTFSTSVQWCARELKWKGVRFSTCLICGCWDGTLIDLNDVCFFL